MKNSLTLLLAIFISVVTFGATTTQAGAWNDPATWGGTVPATGVTIYIWHDVTLSTVVQSSHIYLKENLGAGLEGNLTITGTGILTCGRIWVDATCLFKVLDGGNLVQTYNNANAGLGSYSFNRTGSNSAGSYACWSAPVSAQSFASFVSSGVDEGDIYPFNSVTQKWNAPFLNGYTGVLWGSPYTWTTANTTQGVPLLPSATNSTEVARGYFMEANTALEFTGKPNNGTISRDIHTTTGSGNGSSWTGESWNLIGNPYPSAISATSFWNDNASVLTDALYFWDNAVLPYTYSDYASWNLAGGVAANGAFASGVQPNGEISAYQGFLAMALTTSSVPSTETVVFYNSQRVATAPNFYKNTPTASASQGADQVYGSRYWITARSQDISRSSNILIGEEPNLGLTDQFDHGYDARNASDNGDFNLSTHEEGNLQSDRYTIQTSQDLVGKTIPMALVISADEIGVEFELTDEITYGQIIYLNDNVQNQSYQMQIGQIYNFSVKNTETYRFDLSFDSPNYKKSVTTGINDVLEVEAFEVVVTDGKINLTSKNDLNEAQLLDISGRVLLVSNTKTFNTSGLASGVYIVRVGNESKKVMIK